MIYIKRAIFFTSIFLLTSVIILIILYYKFKNQQLTEILEDKLYKYNILSILFKDIFQSFINYLTLGNLYLVNKNYSSTSFQDFLKSTNLVNSPYINYINEMRIHYNITNNNRNEFVTFMNTQVNNFNIKSNINGNLSISKEFDYYCPITYLSPNITSSLFNFIGVDICHTQSYKNIINDLILNDDDDHISIFSRQIFNSNKIALDIARKSNNGIVIISLLLNEILELLEKTLSINMLSYDFIYNNLQVYSNCNTKCYNAFKFNIIINGLKPININIYDNFSDTNIPIQYISILFSIIITDIIITSIIILSTINYLSIKKQKKMEFSNIMLSYVNHEIRNPLNAIKCLIEISIDDIINNFNKDNIMSNLHTAKNSCSLLEHIVNDILDISRLNEHKLKINNTNIDVKNLIYNIDKILKYKFDEKPQLKFNMNINLLNLVGDQYRIEQLLINLISNSIKYTENGSIDLNIYEFNDFIHFEVKDTGRGIPEENFQNIFKPFEQTDVTDSLRHGGYGL